MLKLLKKEMKLTASPLTYLFILFSVMALIPGYPILVGAFFICLGIFYTFQSGREFNDTFYTALLPVKKSDVVKAKYVFTVFIQFVSFVITAAITVFRMTALSDVSAYVDNPLMNANLAYLGYTLIIFGLFNSIFLAGFFKTAYYIGKPFILYAIAAALVIGIGESLYHFPKMDVLNHTGFDSAPAQSIVLISGLIIYVICTALSLNISKNRFSKIDL